MHRTSFAAPAPNFRSIIAQCCRDSSDSMFEVFRSLWHPYLEAALARFIDDWDLAEALFDAIYSDYRSALREPYNPVFDYKTYFIAVAYSHLMRFSGSPGLMLLLQRLGFGFERQEEEAVLIFCAMFRLSDQCAFYLLSQCFNSSSVSLPIPSNLVCESELRQILRAVLS